MVKLRGSPSHHGFCKSPNANITARQRNDTRDTRHSTGRNTFTLTRNSARSQYIKYIPTREAFSHTCQNVASLMVRLARRFKQWGWHFPSYIRIELHVFDNLCQRACVLLATKVTISRSKSAYSRFANVAHWPASVSPCGGLPDSFSNSLSRPGLREPLAPDIVSRYNPAFVTLRLI